MAARPIASGTISFGLVSIPVKLYSASQPSAGISFNMLCAEHGARLKQHYVCSKGGEAVERDKTVKGYEFAKDRYVQFTPVELKSLEEKSTQAIEIAEFIPMDKIDPVYFDKPYYLGPEKGGEKAYHLLSEAMEKTGRRALARYAARGKQYLVLLRPLDGGLVMQELLYADEVRPFADIEIDAGEVKDNELKLAIQLIDQIATDEFRPDVYKDEVRARVQDAISKKVEGQEISAAPEEAAGPQIIDLMEALKASLAKQSAAPSRSAEGEAPDAPQTRKPARRAAARASEPRAKAAKK